MEKLKIEAAKTGSASADVDRLASLTDYLAFTGLQTSLIWQ
jgi:hypothetical protein